MLFGKKDIFKFLDAISTVIVVLSELQLGYTPDIWNKLRKRLKSIVMEITENDY